MRRAGSRLLPFAFIPLILGGPGCAAIEGIFKAGVWSGVFLVVIAIVVVGAIAAALRR
jgi:hypothetical protein